MTETGTSLAVGVPVFKRTTALRRCLESVSPAAVDRVIVADNGKSGAHEQLYNRDWKFELTVLDLEYDAGIGACRAAIADELTEDYLVVADNDMIIPPASELQHLKTVLESDPNLGVVSGIITEGNRIRSGCSNLHEETSVSGESFLVHAIRSDPEIEWVESTLPIARFDKLTDAAIARRECLEDYSWDSRYPIGEHPDFYLGHYHRTDWEFAVCPAVVFDHQKGRYSSYRNEVRTNGDTYLKKNDDNWNCIRRSGSTSASSTDIDQSGSIRLKNPLWNVRIDCPVSISRSNICYQSKTPSRRFGTESGIS